MKTKTTTSIDTARARKLKWERWLLQYKADEMQISLEHLNTILRDLAENRPQICIKLHKEWHAPLSRI